jgi:hypothetical protein
MIRAQRRSWTNTIARTATPVEQDEAAKAGLFDSPSELSEAQRKLTLLALERRRQNGVLGVRQNEALRRALVFSGKTLGWDLLPGSSAERLASAKKDVATLTEAGVGLMRQDLTNALARKKTEIATLRRVAETLRALSSDATAAYPAEVHVTFSARSGLGRLVTKSESFVLSDGADALRVAEELEKRENDRRRLSEEMVEELRTGRRQLSEMLQDLLGFVEFTGQVLAEVLAIES